MIRRITVLSLSLLCASSLVNAAAMDAVKPVIEAATTLTPVLTPIVQACQIVTMVQDIKKNCESDKSEAAKSSEVNTSSEKDTSSEAAKSQADKEGQK